MLSADSRDFTLYYCTCIDPAPRSPLPPPPRWRKFSFRMTKLCHGPEMNCSVDVWDFQKLLGGGRQHWTCHTTTWTQQYAMSVSSWHRVQDHEGWIGRVLSGNCLLCHTHWICQLWYWLLCFWFKRPELSTRQKNLKWTVSITDAWIGYHMGDSAYDWVKV